MKLHLETLLNSFEVGKWLAKFETFLSSSPVQNISTKSILAHQLLLSAQKPDKKLLPKALWTKSLTALNSNFGLVGLVQYAWYASLIWFGRFGLAGLVW